MAVGEGAALEGVDRGGGVGGSWTDVLTDMRTN